MKKTNLVINDQVNCKFVDLDPHIRRKLVNAMKVFIPQAQHMPAFKLGRWDGKASFATVAGATYLNLLDRALPVVMGEGYEVDVTDNRPIYDFVFPEVKEDMFADRCWPPGHPKAGEPIILRDYQVNGIKTYLDNLQSIQSIATGAGKAQPLWSKIKTPSGWTTMGEVKINDIISTPDGGTAKVLGIYPQGEKEYYKITFSDGRTAEACEDHLWNAHHDNWRRRQGEDGWRIVSTKELLDLVCNNKSKNRYYSIPLGKAEETQKDLPIDPYLLGCLIGDGGLSGRDIEYTTADREIITTLQNILGEEYLIKGRSKKYAYRICSLTNKNHLRRKLNELGLRTRSWEKFIPDEYKCSSIRQRIDLICGLVDTDGTVDKHGSVSITTTSEKLAQDVLYIIRSIGGIARMSHRTNVKLNKKPMRDQYVINIRYSDPSLLSKLNRKKDRLLRNVQYKNKLRLNIKSIEKIGKANCQCILIDSVDHLYMTDNFVVTHNTLITATLSYLVEPYGRSLIIVPSKQLVTQTEEDYKNLGLDCGVYFGDRKDWNKKHTIATWQSLSMFAKKTRMEIDVNIDSFLQDLVCVICDECHLSKADEIKNLLCGPLAKVPIRWGATGTVPKEEHEFLCLLSSIGPVVGEIKAYELQQKGVLANCNVDILQLKDDHVSFPDYHKEYDYLVNDKDRMSWIAEYCEELSKSGNTLILVDRIDTGEFLEKNIPNSVFINGRMKVRDRKKEYNEVQTAQSKILIGTFGVASTGINIPRIFNLVLLEAGKSFTKTIQSVGRSLRMAADKDHAHIIDICSTLKYSARHVSKRRSYYKEANYPAVTRKIDYSSITPADVLK